MPRYYLGVDGGQSSTTALIADESGRVLGRALAGPCNHISGVEAVDKFRRVIGGVIEEARRAAGLDSQGFSFTGACFGFSGGPGDKLRLTQELARSERYYFTHDGEIALAGALAGAPGIIVVSGTGSIAFGKNAAGETARTGGWGYIFGDEGGAFDIVRRALRASLQFEEGWGPATALKHMLLAATGFANVNKLMHAFYTPEWERSRAATLASLVTQAAESGDTIAAQILQESAEKLAWYAQGVYGQLFKQPTLVCPVGGTFQSSPLRAAFDHAVRNTLGCTPQSALQEPAQGALLIARQL